MNSGVIRVTDSNGVRTLTFARNQQSSMRLDDPFETDIEYVGYFHIALAITPRATRTLVIGLGGGSVVKRMWRDYPWMHIDAVEIDASVARIASTQFALPDDERISVIVADGREWLAVTDETYDIVVVDAFADDRIPRPLTTEEFMRECRDTLSPDGVVAMNIIGAVYGPHSKHFRSIHRTASNVWRRVWTFPTGIASDPRDQTRNIVMLATDAALTDDELLGRIASRVDGLVTVPAFERFAEDFYSAKVRGGDVPLLLDPPTGARR
ncbi:methyltransferase domain-containing protein [bacterium]|nr:methyltransferase domain-containing protein [bacterium]